MDPKETKNINDQNTQKTLKLHSGLSLAFVFGLGYEY